MQVKTRRAAGHGERQVTADHGETPQTGGHVCDCMRWNAEGYVRCRASAIPYGYCRKSGITPAGPRMARTTGPKKAFFRFCFSSIFEIRKTENSQHIGAFFPGLFFYFFRRNTREFGGLNPAPPLKIPKATLPYGGPGATFQPTEGRSWRGRGDNCCWLAAAAVQRRPI